MNRMRESALDHVAPTTGDGHDDWHPDKISAPPSHAPTALDDEELDAQAAPRRRLRKAQADLPLDESHASDSEADGAAGKSEGSVRTSSRQRDARERQAQRMEDVPAHGL